MLTNWYIHQAHPISISITELWTVKTWRILLVRGVKIEDLNVKKLRRTWEIKKQIRGKCTRLVKYLDSPCVDFRKLTPSEPWFHYL